MNKYIYMKQGTLQLPLLRFPLDLDLLNMNGKKQHISTKCRRCAMAKPINRSLNTFQRLDIPSTSFEREMYTYHKNLRILPLSSWLQMIFVPKWAVSDCVVIFFRLNWGPNSNQACCCTSISTFIGKLRGVFLDIFGNFEKAPKNSPLDRDQNMISNFQDIFKWRYLKNCKVSLGT